MIYQYCCTKCQHVFDVTKMVKDLNVNEFCIKCESPAERQFTPHIHIMGARVEHAEYNPAFGQVVKGKAHRAELAKRKGMIEIGNEKPETIHKHFDDGRAEKVNKSWEKD